MIEAASVQTGETMTSDEQARRELAAKLGRALDAIEPAAAAGDTSPHRRHVTSENPRNAQRGAAQ